MSEALYQAVAALAAVTDRLNAIELSQPYKWRSHGEGVRMALLGSHFELQELAARLAHRRAESDRPVTWAQRILGQCHTAYRNLQAVLVGFDPAFYDSEPAPDEWSIRYVVSHMANAQRMFLTLVDYGRRMQTDENLPSRIPNDEKERVAGSEEAFQTLAYRHGLTDMLAIFDELHERILTDLATLPDKAMEKAGPV